MKKAADGHRRPTSFAVGDRVKGIHSSMKGLTQDSRSWVINYNPTNQRIRAIADNSKLKINIKININIVCHLIKQNTNIHVKTPKHLWQEDDVSSSTYVLPSVSDSKDVSLKHQTLNNNNKNILFEVTLEVCIQDCIIAKEV